MAFDVAIYTDVLASESIDSIGGFNFQATSPGISGTDRQRIRESLLHRVLPSWALYHDDLSHPPTCAYVVTDGRAYLARGKSTGKTHSGRPGNQLTQVIVTSDLDDFVPYRPAQLYGALEWSLAKAETSEADPWVTPLEIRPEFEVAALQEYVRGDEWVTAVLPQFLTMVEETLAPAPKKLILLHPDLDVVMRWIVLGTLFVDAEAARAVRFRALVDDPRRVDAQIVGVSPEFGVGDFGAANVLDLTRRAAPSAEASDVARVRLDWFLEHGEAGLNAGAIARRWMVLGHDLATAAARLVGLPSDVGDGRAAWETSTAAVARLADAGLRDDLAFYADELCEGVLVHRPTSEEDFRTAGTAIRRAHDLGVDEVARGVALPTLEALAAAPAAERGFTEELSGARTPIVWESADEQETAGRFLGALLAAAAESSLPGLFSAAYVIGSPVPDQQLRPAVATLAARWLRDPMLGRDRWRRWLAGDSVGAATSRQVTDALRAGDEQVLTSVLHGDWNFLTSVVDDPGLTGWLDAGELARIPPTQREQHIARAAGIPAGAWRIGLAYSSLPAHAALWAAWITHLGLPGDLEATVHAYVVAAIGSRATEVDRPETGDWRPLMKSLRGARDLQLTGIIKSYLAAEAAFEETRNRISARASGSLDECLSFPEELAPLLLADIGWLIIHATSAADVKKLRSLSIRWGPDAVRASILRPFLAGSEIRAIERALRGRAHQDPKIVTAAEGVLNQIISARPDLAEPDRVSLSVRGEFEFYLRQRAGLPPAKRRHGLSLGRGRRGES